MTFVQQPYIHCFYLLSDLQKFWSLEEGLFLQVFSWQGLGLIPVGPKFCYKEI